MAFDPTKPRQDNSYFSSMKRKYPDVPNFIVLLKPEQIQRSAKERIFREMVRGQIDYAENGQYFQDSKFLDNLIIACNDELNSKAVIRAALIQFDNTFPGYQQVIIERSRHENMVYVYSLLLERLNAVKFYGDVGYLADIQYVLAGYKNVI